MGLESFERKIAAVVESIFAKGSPRGIEPAELGRRLVREIERSSRVGVRSSIAPNVLTVGLSAEDLQELRPLRSRVESELRVLAEETVEGGDYELLGPIDLQIVEDPELKSGTFYIDCGFREEQGFADRCQLVLQDGSQIKLGSGTHVIGRLAGSAVFVDDARVSRRHAEIVVQDGHVTVFDTGSTNGTFVNGTKISRPTELNAGDVITVGTTDLTVHKG
ncbi:MAG: FhaA domain-containing protein [Ferrimicrobium sp.]